MSLNTNRSTDIEKHNGMDMRWHESLQKLNAHFHSVEIEPLLSVLFFQCERNDFMKYRLPRQECNVTKVRTCKLQENDLLDPFKLGIHQH